MGRIPGLRGRSGETLSRLALESEAYWVYSRNI